jgi:hypothetical protein
MPRAEGTPEAEPQVPQPGGGLARADVRSPLLGDAQAVLALVHRVRQCVKHCCSVQWKFSRAAPCGSSTWTTNGISRDGHRHLHAPQVLQPVRAPGGNQRELWGRP